MSICLDFVTVLGGRYDKEGNLHWPDVDRLYRTEKEEREYRELKEKYGFEECWPRQRAQRKKRETALPGRAGD